MIYKLLCQLFRQSVQSHNCRNVFVTRKFLEVPYGPQRNGMRRCDLLSTMHARFAGHSFLMILAAGVQSDVDSLPESRQSRASAGGRSQTVRSRCPLTIDARFCPASHPASLLTTPAKTRKSLARLNLRACLPKVNNADLQTVDVFHFRDKVA